MAAVPRNSNSFIYRSRIFSSVAAMLVVAIGILVLIGWQFDVTRLKSIYGDITMKPNAALSLILSGTSLWLVPRKNQKLYRIIGQICAVSAGLIGLLTLSQHVFGWNLRIVQLLFIEPPGALATTSPGRMGITASSGFIMYGSALMLLYRRRAISFAQVLTMVCGCVGISRVERRKRYGKSCKYRWTSCPSDDYSISDRALGLLACR